MTHPGLIARLLIVALLLHPAWGRASTIATDEALQAGGLKISPLADREHVALQLQALGVPMTNARDRANALGEDDLTQLEAGIDSLPAGGQFFAPLLILGAIVLVWWAIADSENAKRAFTCFPRSPDRCR